MEEPKTLILIEHGDGRRLRAHARRTVAFAAFREDPSTTRARACAANFANFRGLPHGFGAHADSC